MRERKAVRALILSPEGQVLLMRLRPPGRSFWITPGGGLMAGEGHLAALRRELLEETGRMDFEVGPEVWTRTFAFDTQAGAVTQHERYYLIHSDRFDPEPLGIEGLERDWFAGYRWWPVSEILIAEERFAPRALGALLENLLTNGAPVEPIRLGR